MIETFPCRIQGARLVRFRRHVDQRGLFFESYQAEDFERAGLPTAWPQDNVSVSFGNVLRGLHLQRRNPQGKLVQCLGGEIYDVAVDLRPDSPTFGQWEAVTLSWEHPLAFYIPPGCAHGFYVTAKSALVHYKCTTTWDPESDGGVRWDDRNLGVEWEMPAGNQPIVSPKDQSLPSVDDYLKSLR